MSVRAAIPEPKITSNHRTAGRRLADEDDRLPDRLPLDGFADIGVVGRESSQLS